MRVIESAEDQIPKRTDKTDIINSLKLCITVVGFCNCGCGALYFIDPQSSDWSVEDNIVLDKEDHWGRGIILTVITGRRIGRLEED